MRNRLFSISLAAILLITCSLLVPPSPVKADGGPVLSDPELWAELKEGQQTAVITLKDNNAADVDLFVSMLDNSGQSHEVVFFVPLGITASDFGVVERTSFDFDQELTEHLDEALRSEVQDKRNIGLSMLIPSAVVNGGWMPITAELLVTAGLSDTPSAVMLAERLRFSKDVVTVGHEIHLRWLSESNLLTAMSG